MIRSACVIERLYKVNRTKNSYDSIFRMKGVQFKELSGVNTLFWGCWGFFGNHMTSLDGYLLEADRTEICGIKMTIKMKRPSLK